MMFPHRNIQKYTWTSPDRKTHNRIDQGLIRRWRHSSVLDILFPTEVNCDTDQCLEAAKVRERLSVNKLAAQTFDLERFNLKKLSEAAFW